MTEKNLSNDKSGAPLDDDLLAQDQEAKLYYRGVRGSRKKDAKSGRGPVPLAGGQSAGAPAPAAGTAGVQPAGQAAGNAGLTAQQTTMPTAMDTAAAGSVGVMAAGSDVRFDSEQLAASGIDNAEDPWGAYDNPENIPGMSLDDDDDPAENEWTAMALRGSGTRGGSKDKRGGMGPMMPMGGAGAGAGAGAGGTAAGGTPVGGGAPGGMMLPNATVGGVGGAQTMAAQQLATGAPNSAAALAGMQAPRATSAMFSPPSSGVLAAGSNEQDIDPVEFTKAIREAGVDTDAELIEGPDGNLYPNPYYSNAGSNTGSNSPGLGGVHGADLNGDGWVSEQELARWNAGQHKTNAGYTQPGPGASHGVSAPQTSSASDGVRQGVDGLNSDAYRATSGQASSGHEAGQSSSGVNQQVSGLNSTQYSQMSHHSTHSPVGKQAFPQGAAAASGSGRAGGSASAKDFSVESEELRVESKEWDSIARQQAKLKEQYAGLAKDHDTFGVMYPMMNPAYEMMRNATVTSTAHRTGKNQYTSEHLVLSAEAYDQTETENAQRSDREIP